MLRFLASLLLLGSLSAHAQSYVAQVGGDAQVAGAKVTSDKIKISGDGLNIDASIIDKDPARGMVIAETADAVDGWRVQLLTGPGVQLACDKLKSDLQNVLGSSICDDASVQGFIVLAPKAYSSTRVFIALRNQ
jgi:hypothetical protein